MTIVNFNTVYLTYLVKFEKKKSGDDQEPDPINENVIQISCNSIGLGFNLDF